MTEQATRGWAETTTATLDVPGCTLTYDVRRNETSTEPPLLVIGSPMGASGFGSLVGHFPDRTVVTYDPRGAERSKRTDGAAESTPEEHAGDLHALIGAIGGGPVDIFASSGGAVNALALVARHPEDVRILVAHEPPAFSALPDADRVLAVCEDIRKTYLGRGFGPGMAKFIALASFDGPLPADYLERPEPDPAMFGLPAGGEGGRDDPLLGQNMVTCGRYEHDYAALRAAPTRIVIGVGIDSANAIAGRGGRAVAERIGVEPVMFPGGHGGFGAGGQGPDTSEAFAATLREVLASVR